MRISEICIKRPVLSIVINLILILVGVVAFSRLSMTEYPRTDKPSLMLETDMSGAGPEVIENQVTKILEDELSKIEGLDFTQSQSMRGKSKVFLNFNPDRSLDAASTDVLFKVARIHGLLPTNVRQPTMSKEDANAQPCIWIAFSGKNRSASDMEDYAKRYIETQLANLNGVSKVDIIGGGQFEMKVYLDPKKLSAHGLNALDVYNKIRAQNIEMAGGVIVAGERQFNIATNARLRTPDDFNQLIVGDRNGHFVRLHDVGNAAVGSKEDANSAFYYNGNKAVALAIYKKSEESPIAVVDRVKAALPKIKDRLPSDMTLEVAYDTTVFIKVAVTEVYETILIAIVLVLLVVLIFIGSFRASFIPMVTIPVSLIGACILIYAFGFTINILTLLAMVLAVGLVVDDAIVVLENVYRYIEEGLSPMAAALKGSKEIGFAVVAMTLTLAAVYAPLALAQGMTGQLFREFALTLAGAVILSGIVALTLSPMMCSRLLKNHKDESAVTKGMVGAFFGKVANTLKKVDLEYAFLLKIALKHRLAVLFIGGVFTGASWVLMNQFLPPKFIPDEDRGVLVGNGQGAKGVTTEGVDRYTREVDAILDSVPEIDSRLVVVEPNKVTAIATLKHWSKRKRSSTAIAQSTNSDLKRVVGLGISMVDPRPFGGERQEGALSFVMQSMRPMDDLIAASRKFLQVISEKEPNIQMRFMLPVSMQDFNVNVNRDIAAYSNLSAEDIASLVEIYTKGRKVGNYMPAGDTKEYDTIVGVEKEFRRSPSDIADMTVVTRKGNTEKTVPLNQLISVDEQMTSTHISHYNRMRCIDFFASLENKYSISKAINQIEALQKSEVGKDYIIDWTGETRKFIQESGNMLFVMILALFFIYLVLAAQFESFIDPLTILVSVPLSLAGAVITLLMINDGSFNIFSQIGMVTLIGLITKHGILIVDFANNKLEEGLDAIDAVFEACKLRLRPILMTTGAMVLGALPLALATGAGSEIRSNVGWVIVGGMTFGTLFTLFVVPVVYTFFSRKRKTYKELVEL